jgi:hypothetical protein
MSCWGGAFHGMFPTDGLSVPDGWWRVLHLLDPDIVYSLTPLDPKLVDDIDRRVCPARIANITADARTRSPNHLIDRFEIGGAGVAGLPAALWEDRTPHQVPRFAIIKDSWRAGLSDRSLFTLLNFGALEGTIYTDAAFRDVEASPFDLESVEPSALYDAQTFGYVLTTPLDLAAAKAPRPLRLSKVDLEEHCQIVVGDHVLDLMYAWNRRYLIAPPGRGRSVVWLPRSLAIDEEELTPLGEWLGRTYWPPPGGSCSAAIISYSLDADAIAKAKDAFGAATRWYTPVVYQPAKHEMLVPADAENFGIPNQDPEPQHVTIVDQKALLRYDVPVFLRRPNAGRVMLEAALEFQAAKYLSSDTFPVWSLPRRLNVAQMFFRSRDARIVRGGVPATAVAPTESATWIEIPTYRSIVWACIEHQRPSERNNLRYVRDHRFQEFRTSNTGLRVQAVIQLFGGLSGVRSVFEDRFWHRLLLKLAGIDRDAISERSETVNRLLGDFFRADPTPVSPDKDRAAALAQFIGRRFVIRRRIEPPVTLPKMKQWFGLWKGEGLKNQTEAAWWKEAQFDDWTKRTLERLLHSGILQQGCEVRCETCGSDNWHEVEALRSVVPCPGCATALNLGADPEWSFRLNEMLASALDREGVLPVLLALIELDSWIVRDALLYLPPQDIFEDRKGGGPFTDVDLFFIRNGKFGIAEIKSDPAAFEPEKLEKLAVVAEDLRPDVVLLAAVGKAFPASISKSFESLAERLGNHHISVKPWLMSWDDTKWVLEFE